MSKNSVAVTSDQLHTCLAIAAGFVEAYGEKFMPYFDRIESDLAKLNEQESKMDKIQRLARASTDARSISN